MNLWVKNVLTDSPKAQRALIPLYTQSTKGVTPYDSRDSSSGASEKSGFREK